MYNADFPTVFNADLRLHRLEMEKVKMPFPGVTLKNTRKYEDIKASVFERELKGGASRMQALKEAKRVAAATVNKGRKPGQSPITHKKGR